MRFSNIERKVHFCFIPLAWAILYIERSEYSKIAYFSKETILLFKMKYVIVKNTYFSELKGESVLCVI